MFIKFHGVSSSSTCRGGQLTKIKRWVKVRSLLLKIYPVPQQNQSERNEQKPKGGPLDEKNIFFKKVLRIGWEYFLN